MINLMNVEMLSYVGAKARVLVFQVPDSEVVGLAVSSGSRLFIRMDVNPRLSKVLAPHLPLHVFDDAMSSLGLSSDDIRNLGDRLRQGLKCRDCNGTGDIFSDGSSKEWGACRTCNGRGETSFM